MDPASGYPVIVSIPDSAVDRTFLAEVARALAYRWVVPSRRRGDYTAWDRVSRRQLPPEPRWADDWQPADRHRARFAVALLRNGTARAGSLLLPSGDRSFDQSLRTMVDRPLPGSPRLPILPAGFEAESLVVTVSLGLMDSTAGTSAVVRFAAQQEPVRLVPGTLRIEAFRGPGTPSAGARRATVKYDVTVGGVVDMSTFEVLESSDADLVRGIRDGLVRARFTPAESNCRPVTLSVVQTVGQ